MCSKRQLRSTKPSSPGEWLIGEYHKELITTRIPSRREVLSFFLFHHYENKLTIADTLKLTTQKIQQCWEPKVTIKDFHIKEKIKKIFNTWQKLKKNRLRLTNVQRENENAFLKSLDDMFECELQTKENNLTTESVTHSKKALSPSNSEPPVLLSQKSNASGCSVSSYEFYPSTVKKRKLTGPRKKKYYDPGIVKYVRSNKNFKP